MIYVLAAARVIGIILLVIVILVILLLIIPVCYKLDADLTDRSGFLQFTWLLHFIRFRLVLDEESEAVLSILFFHIDFLDEKRRAKRKEKRERAKKEKEAEETEPGVIRRVVAFVKSGAHIIALMREHEVLAAAYPSLRLFLFRSRPRDVHGCVEFGMSDPSRTGRIVAAVSTIPVIYQTELSIVPDFDTEEDYVRGEIHLGGHTMMIHLLVLVIRLFRKKEIREFISDVRHKK